MCEVDIYDSKLALRAATYLQKYEGIELIVTQEHCEKSNEDSSSHVTNQPKPQPVLNFRMSGFQGHGCCFNSSLHSMKSNRPNWGYHSAFQRPSGGYLKLQPADLLQPLIVLSRQCMSSMTHRPSLLYQISSHSPLMAHPVVDLLPLGVHPFSTLGVRTR